MHLVSWEHISPCPIGGSKEPCLGPSLSPLLLRAASAALQVLRESEQPLHEPAVVLFGGRLLEVVIGRVRITFINKNRIRGFIVG